MAANGVAIGTVGVGILFAYAGIKGYSIPATIQDVVSGKTPLNQVQTTAITGSTFTTTGGTITSTGGGPQGGTNAQNAALGKLMAAGYGWATGSEWTAVNNIAMAESGWSSTITNPSSGAAGIAQKIAGFGPGYESGNARQQIAWFYRYIKQRYGDPIAAWNFHLAHNWY